jgi:hypothetical protein
VFLLEPYESRVPRGKQIFASRDDDDGIKTKESADMAKQFLGERNDKLTTPVRGGRQGRHGDCVTPQNKEELVYYVIISHALLSLL